MFKNIKIILIFSAVVIFLIIYPYSKEPKIFRINDINWDKLNNSKKYQEFDSRTFGLIQTFEFSEDALKLDGQTIVIKGFLKKHQHGNSKEIFITETVTDVCFMCNHDEDYNMILLKLENNATGFNDLTDDTLIKVSGTFRIDKNKNAHSAFILEKVKLEEINETLM